MLKGLILGIVLGVLLVAAGVYFYFATGHAPVAVADPAMPFEKKLAHLALASHLAKQPKKEPAVAADEIHLLAGARIYRENCAVCHGLPGKAKTAVAEGMYPGPPQLFYGMGVTDDPVWETYWKVKNGIRMTGMPGFEPRLTETELWQVSQLVANADKISPAVDTLLKSEPPPLPAELPARH